MTQIIFVAVAIVVVLLIIGTFYIAMRFKKEADYDEGASEADRRAVRVALQKEHAELSARHERGRISDAAFEKAERALAQRLLDEGGLPPEKTPHKGAAGEGGFVKVTALAISLLLPITGAGLYLFYGDFSSLQSDALAQVAATREAVANEKTMQGVINKLEIAVEKDRNNLSAWEILAEHYAQNGNLAQAEMAYENVVRLNPKDARAISSLIDVEVGLHEGVDPNGKIPALVEKALALDPFEPKILLLGGFIAYQKGEYEKAALYWNRLKSIVPPNDPMEQMIDANLAEALKAGNLSAPPKDIVLEQADKMKR